MSSVFIAAWGSTFLSLFVRSLIQPHVSEFNYKMYFYGFLLVQLVVVLAVKEPGLNRGKKSSTTDDELSTTTTTNMSSNTTSPVICSTLTSFSGSFSSNFNPPHQRSLADWMLLPRESLILHAGAVHVPVSGSSSGTIAQGLYRFYHPHAPTSCVNQSIPSNVTVTVVSPVSSPSLITAVPTTSSYPVSTTVVSSSLSQALPSGGNPYTNLNNLTQTIRNEITAALAGLINTGQSQHIADSLLPGRCQLPQFGVSSADAGSQLPAIPSSILDKIQRGEFVNFDLLLPNNVPSQTHNSYTMSLDDSIENPQIVVRNSQQSKHKVIDLHSWLLAWSLFFQCVVIFRGHLACQLISYVYR